jgi:glutaredoxin
MYSTTTCTTCVGLEKWLTQAGFAYEKKMADSDPAIMEEFMNVTDGMIGVPFTVITADDGTVSKITGYDRSALKAALGIA